MTEILKELTGRLVDHINSLPNEDEKIQAINFVRREIHQVSPMRDNPVDFVEWVKSDYVRSNDYNPNQVAPPEMKLLKLSIDEDGYTQPIVSDHVTETDREVVDGFHRSRIGKEYKDVKSRLHGYLPIVTIRNRQRNKKNRIAATIRHNRARGTHNIRGMSEIVLSLIELGWVDEDIAKYLGMEAEEVFRLKQITGIKQAFANHEFSKSWEEFESKVPKE
jgi:ParB-like chromosome segregation protein Spo0J